MQSGDGQTDLNVDVQRNVTEIQLVVKRPRGVEEEDAGLMMVVVVVVVPRARNRRTRRGLVNFYWA